MDSPPELLERILSPGQIRTVYQPILRIASGQSDVFGLEALTRGPRGTSVESPDILFEYSRRKHKEALVDLACLQSAIKHAAGLPRFGKLFINMHASTLANQQAFVETLASVCTSFSFTPHKIVIEVVEHSPYWDREDFVHNMRRLRELGVRVAVDDLGVAYSSFKMILDVIPNYLKIDMDIIRGCGRDRIRRAMIESFFFLGNEVGAELIAEGVEEKEDFDILRSMGLTLFQGYLFSRPEPPDVIETMLATASDYDQLLPSGLSNSGTSLNL